MIKKIAEFKDRFNKALSLRDIRPVEVTAQTGISESTISQYRSGYAKPKSDKLQKLSDCLDVNPAWLMGLDVPMDVKVVSYDTPFEYESAWATSGGGNHPILLSQDEKLLIEQLRKSDEDTKRMVERILAYSEITQAKEEKPRGFAAHKISKPSEKLINRRKNES